MNSGLPLLEPPCALNVTMSPGELSRSGRPLTSRSRSLVTAKPGLANADGELVKKPPPSRSLAFAHDYGAATREQAKADQREECPDHAEDDLAAPRTGRRAGLDLWNAAHGLTHLPRHPTWPHQLGPTRHALDASNT